MSIELIDAQTLMPFDIYGVIGQSIRKTNRVIFIDEDVPGGAAAYMLDQVFKDKELLQFLDGLPQTLSGQPNRSAYASDGDYFCKPNAEDIYEAIYAMMSEVDPDSYPEL